MKPHLLGLSVLTAAITLITPYALAQISTFENTALNTVSLSSDNARHSDAMVSVAPRPIGTSQKYRPFSNLGFATRVGPAGAGFDFATPLVKKFNLRTGTDFFNYSTSFQEEGANVGINLHLRSGYVALDWFPFGGQPCGYGRQ